MIKKQYLKSKPICKVTFTLPLEAVGSKTELRLVGDFNNWSWEAGTPMKAGKKEYAATVNLATGRDYQFRYMKADGSFENDWAADAYIPSPFGSDNSLVKIEATPSKEGEAAPKAKATTKAAASTKKVAKKPAAKKTAAKKPATKKRTASKAKKDNLKKIEGIGPKIEKLLKEKGIETFEALSKTKITTLKEVLAEAGSRFKSHDPGTWAEQATLAAAGDFDKLTALQAKLKGGKR